ncbi:Flp pilus assembly protein TadD [Azospirillum lipoferum]|uniref:Uncharacterized protein n=1 Tax=Azospirillum lipoferum TaxID=193 RepID=A0A5A9GUL9_AZOLI|nr:MULTISPECIES: hypothetical protein [Azospirillum]KAA0598033.1 hypothetical protein FZ942_02745 [Azospirillum lipoferum]MCP1613857.1 Flp pilus assembly protein TadD [Azospirillum lipoferum]MDW5534691.1 hypothetical protein [Azospirillum sp. NL1]
MAVHDLAAAAGLFREGRRQEAFDVCALILGGRPDNGDAWQLSAIIRFQQGTDGAADAIARQRNACACDPARAEYAANLAAMLKAYGDGGAALVWLRRTALLTPADPMPWRRLAAACQQAGDRTGTVDAFREAAARYPLRSDLHADFGAQALQQEDGPTALRAFGNGLALAPGNADALRNLGVATLRHGPAAEAVDWLTRLLTVEPDHEDGFCDLALALHRRQAESGHTRWRQHDRRLFPPVPDRLRVFYRLSDRGNPKEKIAGPFACLANFLDVFRPAAEELRLIADNCRDDTVERVEAMLAQAGCLGTGVIRRTALGHHGSFLHAKALALADPVSQDAIVYFLEDDYLHLPGARAMLAEGLQIADYVTLYDHADKYADPAATSLHGVIAAGGEETCVLRRPLSHWKFTASTTMTWACRLSTLRADSAVWDRFRIERRSIDYCLHYTLGAAGRFLACPLPGHATHGEANWASPGRDWPALARQAEQRLQR